MFPLPKGKPEFSLLEEKQFDIWNGEKKTLHMRQIPKDLFINPREIWYVKQGINIGNEENGKGEFRRPILVIRRIGNMYFGIPLTTKGKQDNQYYIPVISLISPKNSWIITSQAKTYDKRRFMELMGTLSPEEFYAIKKSLKKTYFGEIE